MEARVDEIADGIYRLSSYVPAVAPPAGFTFNQFLIHGEEPLLFHAGLRRRVPAVVRRPRRESCRPIGCDGSRSVTSRPTNVGR